MDSSHCRLKPCGDIFYFFNNTMTERALCALGFNAIGTYPATFGTTW